MGYNKNNFKRIRQEYATKHLVAENAAQMREREVHSLLPDVAQIDRRLAGTGLALMGAALLPEGEQHAKLEALRAENEALLARRGDLLAAAGFPRDYTDVKYDCPLCGDTGYVGIRMCECMRRDLILAGYESSGIARLLEKQTFDNFSLDYYKSDEATLRGMTRNLEITCEYADTFCPATSGNLALFGGTGLGKTHLSSAIARTVIEKGYDVVYTTAVQLFSDFETEQFGSRTVEKGELCDKYFECDLLIIDDLGTEVVNQFTVSTLYNLLNVRINRHAPMILNTNLSQGDLLKKYTDRVTSRLFGEFRPLLFSGADVRMQKISRGGRA